MDNKNLSEHYDNLYNQASQKILKNEYSIDKDIENPVDKRFGITVLIKPGIEIANNIQGFLEELKSIEPEQYFYPNSDLHITVLSIISCYDGFNLANISVDEYSKIISKSLESINEFEIEFKGITASDSAIMIQGFPKENTLNDIRGNLRDNFRKSTLQQSIDKRYSLATAHITVVRFKEKLKNPEKLMQTLEKYRNHNFGTSKIQTLDLVYNDWYQRNEFVQKLVEFKIKTDNEEL